MSSRSSFAYAVVIFSSLILLLLDMSMCHAQSMQQRQQQAAQQFHMQQEEARRQQAEQQRQRQQQQFYQDNLRMQQEQQKRINDQTKAIEEQNRKSREVWEADEKKRRDEMLQRIHRPAVVEAEDEPVAAEASPIAIGLPNGIAGKSPLEMNLGQSTAAEETGFSVAQHIFLWTTLGVILFVLAPALYTANQKLLAAKELAP